MALYVHLTFAENAKAIQRSGITPTRLVDNSKGVFALPVIQNFYISHQWVRELKRRPRGSGLIVGVYLRIPDDEIVRIGHYGYLNEKEKLTATQAASVMLECENRLGFEVIISRRIHRSEIHKIKRLPQGIGWRYRANSHGIRPCPCRYCNRGTYGAQQIREKYDEPFYTSHSVEELQQRIIDSVDIKEINECLLEMPRKRIRVNPAFLYKIFEFNNPDLLESLAFVLVRFQHPEVRKMLVKLVEYPDNHVKKAAVESIWALYRYEAVSILQPYLVDLFVATTLADCNSENLI